MSKNIKTAKKQILSRKSLLLIFIVLLSLSCAKSETSQLASKSQVLSIPETPIPTTPATTEVPKKFNLTKNSNNHSVKTPEMTPDTSSTQNTLPVKPNILSSESIPVEVFKTNEEPIRIGYAAVDVERVRKYGIDVSAPPFQPWLKALFETINEEGGIFGRKLELFYREFFPIGNVESEALCQELAQDIKVFIVLGHFLDDNPLCLTEVNRIPYIGWFGLTPERQARSSAPFFAIEMDEATQKFNSTYIAIKNGDLLDKRVALFWEAADRPIAQTVVLPTLEENDISVLLEIELPYTEDPIAKEDAFDSIMESIRASEVEVIINVSGVEGFARALERADFIPQLVIYQNGQAGRVDIFADINPKYLSTSLAYVPFQPQYEDVKNDLKLQACINIYENNNPLTPINLQLGDQAYVQAVVRHCAMFELLILLLESAGQNLTTESLLLAAENLGEFSLPGITSASLNKNKHSVENQMQSFAYNDVAKYLTPISGPITINEYQN